MASAIRADILREGESVLGGANNLQSQLTFGDLTFRPAAADRAAAQSYLDGRFAAAAHQTALRGGPPLRVPEYSTFRDARYGAMTLEDMVRAGREIRAADNIAEEPEDYSSAADHRRLRGAVLPSAEHPTFGLQTPEMTEELATSLRILRGDDDDRDDDRRDGDKLGKRKSRKNKTKKEKGKNKKSSNKRKSSKSRKGSRKNKH